MPLVGFRTLRWPRCDFLGARILGLTCPSQIVLFGTSTSPNSQIVLCYFLNYIDRTNLGNARTLNNDKPGQLMVEVLGLSGSRCAEPTSPALNPALDLARDRGRGFKG